jgi:hypothetical protein
MPRLPTTERFQGSPPPFRIANVAIPAFTASRVRLPAGFKYEHEVSETSNTIAFDTGIDDRDLQRCVVCGRKAEGGPHPGVTRAHVIGRTEHVLVRNCFLL